jgi:hypothetical protein
VDAVGVLLGVGLLLRREQLPLPERVHRRVRVLAQLRQGGDVNEVDGHAVEVARQHTLRSAVQPPIRPDVQRRRTVQDRLRLHRALDPARVTPNPRPAHYSNPLVTASKHAQLACTLFGAKSCSPIYY